MTTLRLVIAAAVALAASSHRIGAQVQWTLRQPSQQPPGHGTMIADPFTRTLLLLQPEQSPAGSWFSRHWHWDGADWSERTPAVTPPYLSGGAIAHDPVRNRIVWFGGNAPGRTMHGETWTWDGSTWTLATTAGPSPRQRAAMAFLPSLGSIVLFGGDAPPAQHLTANDTWAFDGTAWRQLRPTTVPPGRNSHTLTFDPVSRRLLMFGGYTSWTTTASDTWAFDGSKWTAVGSGTLPPPRGNHSAAFDRARARLVVFGGALACCWPPTLHRDTWEWDGRSWLRRHPSSAPPGSLAQADHAYDPWRDEVVLWFGGTGPWLGYTSTWTYGPTQPGSLAIVGNGGGGPSGAPQLTSRDGARPFVGTPLGIDAQLASHPTVGGVLLMGPARAIPLDLGSVGMAGCALHVDALASLPGLGGLGRVDWAVPIPLSPGLVGTRVRMQAVVTDPAANPLGLGVSQALDAVVGNP